MRGKSTKARGKAEPEAPDLAVVAKEWAELRPLTGSDSGTFNLKLLNQVWNALWRLENGAERATQMGQLAARGALRGIAPRDPLEGMLAAQMIATHEAAMECFRRAHLPGQTFEGRQAALGQANNVRFWSLSSCSAHGFSCVNPGEVRAGGGRAVAARATGRSRGAYACPGRTTFP